jgi:hypothetical protein
MPTNRLAPIIPGFDSKDAKPTSIECIVGDTIRRVRIWSEAEWANFDPAERPSPAEYFPGLGWIGVESRRKLD